MEKYAPEKITPLVPIIFGFFWDSMYIENQGYEKFLREMDRATLQEILIKGLSDYDFKVRGGTVLHMIEETIIENLELIINAYKIETNLGVQFDIELQLFENLNEKIAEVIFDLVKNYRLKIEDEYLSFSDIEFYPGDEMIKKGYTYFSSKREDEKDQDF